MSESQEAEAEETEGRDTEEDIGGGVILSLLGMEGVVRDVQVQNYFYLGLPNSSSLFSKKSSKSESRTSRVSLSLSGIIIHGEDRYLEIPFSDILTVVSSRSYDTRKEPHNKSRGIKLNKFSFRIFKSSMSVLERVPQCPGAAHRTGSQFGFLGSLPDTLTIHYVEHRKNRNMELNQLSLHHEDPDVIGKWNSLLGERTRGGGRPTRLLVFINPFGGKGRGKKLWEEKVAPLFKLAGVQAKVVVTEFANHAQSLLQTIPLSDFSGVISVGGDGMFAEVFNGMLQRTAKDEGVDLNCRNSKVLPPNIRVGFIPGGSTDSISLCLHGTADPVTAALHILLGDCIKVDAVSIHSPTSLSSSSSSTCTQSTNSSSPSPPSPTTSPTSSSSPSSPTSYPTKFKLERFSMTMVSYGYFGDLMKHSESMRWLGRQRYDISGIRTFLALRSYKGTVKYSPSSSPDPLVSPVCREACTHCTQSSSEPLGDREEGDKVTLEGKFLAITTATLSCSCPHSIPGVSPTAHTGDGATDLIIVKKTGYFNYLRYLFRVALNLSSPFTLPFVQAVRVTDWSFTDGEEGGKQSVWNCDGEILETPSIVVRVHRQVVPVFARGVPRTDTTQLSYGGANPTNYQFHSYSSLSTLSSDITASSAQSVAEESHSHQYSPSPPSLSYSSSPEIQQSSDRYHESRWSRELCQTEESNKPTQGPQTDLYSEIVLSHQSVNPSINLSPRSYYFHQSQ